MVPTGAKKILTNAKYLYLALLTSQSLRFVYMLILARMLGAELYGLFSYGQSWYLMFLPLTGLGLGAMLSREVGKNRENAKPIVDLVASIRVAAVSIVAIISMSCGIFYADNQFVAMLLTIFSVALIGKAMILWANQMLQAFESTQVIFKIERIFKPCEILVSIAVAVTTKNILLIACVHALCQVVQGLVSIHIVTRTHTNINLVFLPRLMTATIIKLSPLAIAIVAGQYMFFGPIVQSKELLDSSEQHGNFSLLMQLFVVCLSVFSSIAGAALPALSRSASYNRDSLNLFSRITIYLACMSGIFVFIFSELVGSFLLRFAFSTKFELASEYLSLMMLVLIPAVVTSLLNSVQISLEKNFKVFFTNVLAAGVLILSMPILTELYGFKGAVYSMLAGFSCSAFASSLFLFSESIVYARDTFFVPFLILSGTAAIIYSGKYVGHINWGLILGGVYSVSILWISGLSQKDKASIINKFKSFKGNRST